MAEEENIYYIEKQGDGNISVDSNVVWQDGYTEVVPYEENVESSHLNITYVTDENTSANEHYDTALEDNTQYYSVIETANDSIITEDESVLHDTTLQQSTISFNDNTKTDFNINQYSPGSMLSDQIPSENVNFVQNTNDGNEEFIIPDSQIIDSGITTEDDDQVILYKVEDSNELFAVQIARDADGNVQKYQYKVRQNEDGQLEAVPGTIQLQPEGTDQLIYEETLSQPEVNVKSEAREVNFIENDNNLEKESEAIRKDLEEESLQQQSESYYDTDDNQFNSLELENQQLAEETSQYQENVEENEISEETKYLKGDIQTIPPTYYEEQPGEVREEFTDIEYLQEEFQDEQQFEQFEEAVESTPEVIPTANTIPQMKQYKEGSKIHVLSSQVVLQENDKIEKTIPVTHPSQKQILNKITDCSLNSDDIELKRISNTVSNKTNKLTFLIVTHPVPQQIQQKIPITRPPFQQNKKFRSILRPTVQTTHQKVNHPVFKANGRQIHKKIDIPATSTTNNQKILLVNNISHKNYYSAHNLLIKDTSKGPRQPRKQTIKPVDRVGSEIIIQAPEDKQQPVETLDLDEITDDDDYLPKQKILPKIKKLHPKKRGRKPTKHLVTVSNQTKLVGNDPKTKTQDESTNNFKTVTQIQKFDSNTLPPKKRGPGRPRLSEKKSHFIEKEVIMEHVRDDKNGTSTSLRGRGRPKFIRTQRKLTTYKSSAKDFDTNLKENNSDNVKSSDEVNLPRRRGRPPKKYSPEIETVKKRGYNKSTQQKLTVNRKLDLDTKNYFGFSSEGDNNDAENDEPEVKKLKVEMNDTVDNIMNEIHGNVDENHPVLEEHDSKRNTENQGTETLLSILEETPVPKMNEEKEDMLTRALKDADINTSDNEELTDTSQNSFLELRVDQVVDDTELKKTSPDPEVESMQSESVPVLKELEISNTIISDSVTEEDITENTQFEVKRSDQIECVSAEKETCNTENIQNEIKTEQSEKIKSVSLEMETSKGPVPRKVRNPAFKCIKCSKTFTNYLSLKWHLVEHNSKSKGKFKCAKCPRIFILESALNYHEKTIHCEQQKINTKSVDNNYNCIECSKTFATIVLLRNHQQFAHKQFKCDKCTDKFTTRSQLHSHMRNHLQTPDNKRKLRRSTVTKTEFSEIIRNIEKTDKLKRKTIASSINVTSLNAATTSESSLQQESHRCPICLKTFRQLAHLVMHRDVHNKPTCANCGQVFPFRHTLSEHMRRYCLKSPINNRKLTINRQSVGSTNIFNCDKCKKTFKNQIFFSNHLKIHMKSPSKRILNNNSTQLRRKTYAPSTTATDETRNKLESEEATANDNRVRAAPITERRQSGRIQVPSKKVMPIRCDMCNLSFSTYTGLFRHTRSHPDITVKCDHCHAGFETQVQLVKHLETHVSDVKITCPQCQKAFESSEEINSHNCENKSTDSVTSVHVKPKTDLLSAMKQVKLDKKKMPHGGIPISLKMRKKLLQRKLELKKRNLVQ